jgi:hypothetical protein
LNLHDSRPSSSQSKGASGLPLSDRDLLTRNSQSAQETRIVEEFTAAWARGERPPAEVFLDRYSGLTTQPDAAIRLIYEEIFLRQGEGQEV